MKKTTISLIIILLGIAANAQLFHDKTSYPGVSEIKGKYYSGTGGGGYWTLEKLDNQGRTISKENYRKRTLLSQTVFRYNDKDDITCQIEIYSINDPKRKDTLSYSYIYDGEVIIKQVSSWSKADSSVYMLIDIKGDTAFNYKHSRYFFRNAKNRLDIYEERITAVYGENLLRCLVEFDVKEDKSIIKRYTYYENGKRKRLVTEYIPEPEVRPVYAGGPGSEDMQYEYKYDKAGRIVKYFRIVNGTKYKIAVYKYKKV